VAVTLDTPLTVPTTIAEPDFHYYIYDHLGNTRIVYSTELVGCGSEGGVTVEYTLEAVMDYFPYGKILRQYIKTTERYVTTGHERDAETGLDYRGARFYDADVARFLSLDPLAAEFPAWSDYNYVLGNPVMFIDPDGKAPKEVSKNCCPGYEPTPTVAGVIYESYQYARSALFNMEMRVIEAMGYGDENTATRMRVKHNEYGEIETGSPVNIQKEEKKGIVAETFDIALDVLSLSPLGELASTRGAVAVPFLAVKTPTSSLRNLISTEPLAQGETAIKDIMKKLDEGDLFIYNESINTVEVSGKSYILDGHNRIEAAIRGGHDLHTTNLSTDQASKLYPDKYKQIINGEFD
jgi:RHS repeat-associated protein